MDTKIKEHFMKAKMKIRDKLKNKFKKKIETIHPMNFNQKLIDYCGTTSSSTQIDLQIDDFENKALRQASLKSRSYRHSFLGWSYEDLEYFIIIGLLHQYPNTFLNLPQKEYQKTFPLLLDGDIVDESLKELSENWPSYPIAKDIVIEFNLPKQEDNKDVDNEDDDFVEISTPTSKCDITDVKLNFGK